MFIVRITPTQFTVKPSNRPASTELAYGKTQGIILKTNTNKTRYMDSFPISQKIPKQLEDYSNHQSK